MKDAMPQAYPLLAVDEKGDEFFVVGWDRVSEYETALRPIIVPVGDQDGKPKTARSVVSKKIIRYYLTD